VLQSAGIDPNSLNAISAANAAVAKLQQLIAQQQQSQQNQNASGTGNWIFGQIWPGVAYKATYLSRAE
jgi:hypothetical protein